MDILTSFFVVCGCLARSLSLFAVVHQNAVL